LAIPKVWRDHRRARATPLYRQIVRVVRSRAKVAELAKLYENIFRNAPTCRQEFAVLPLARGTRERGDPRPKRHQAFGFCVVQPAPIGGHSSRWIRSPVLGAAVDGYEPRFIALADEIN
jgi:UDP-N-acetyl-D-mannosaminuronate dehydrogenase